MKKNSIVLTLGFLLAAQGVAVAAPGSDSAALPSNAKSEFTAFCPQVDEITKDNQTQQWNGQSKYGTWKGYNSSFATDLTRFLGVQWNGAQVGQITCVYKAEQRFKMQGNITVQPAMNVTLVFYSLAVQPSSGKWKQAGSDVYNCYSADQNDCPFQVRIKQKIENIYEEAALLKSDGAAQPESY